MHELTEEQKIIFEKIKKNFIRMMESSENDSNTNQARYVFPKVREITEEGIANIPSKLKNFQEAHDNIISIIKKHISRLEKHGMSSEERDSLIKAINHSGPFNQHDEEADLINGLKFRLQVLEKRRPIINEKSLKNWIDEAERHKLGSHVSDGGMNMAFGDLLWWHSDMCDEIFAAIKNIINCEKDILES